MYEKYHTDALVLAAYGRRESDLLIDLLTRDLGRVYAHARSARTLNSKLRFGIQKYSLPRVSLIQGASGWRLTNATPGDNFMSKVSSETRSTLTHVINLVGQLVSGTLPDEALFDDVHTGLLQIRGADTNDLKDVEMMVVARILLRCGILPETIDAQDIYASSEKSLVYVRKHRRPLTQAINTALSSL